MLGAPHSSQKEQPQNLTTSSQSVVMVAPHHAPWHLHPQPLHVMYPPVNPGGVASNDSSAQPTQGGVATQTSQAAAAAVAQQQNSQGGGTHLGDRLPNDQQMSQLQAPPVMVEHSIWSTADMESSQNGLNSTYSLTELQNSNSDSALTALEIEEEEIETKPKIKKEIKKKRKLADLLAEGIDPTKLEENSEQVRERFEKGCECEGDNCFKNMNPEFVFRHRLNIAELTKNEHDLYLMGVTMACLANPEETSRHKERKRLRASYVFQGKKVCLDAFLYLENCTHYQLKAIRKHVMVNGVTPRVHGNHGKKPPNTFPLDTYQHAAAFLQSYVSRYSPNGATPKKPNKSGKSPPVYLPADITRKKIHNAYKEYCEHFEPDVKVMGYSSFRHFMKEQFPNVKFFRIDKKSDRGGVGHSDDDDDDSVANTPGGGGTHPASNQGVGPPHGGMDQQQGNENQRGVDSSQQAQQQQVMQQPPPPSQPQGGPDSVKEGRRSPPATSAPVPHVPLQPNLHQGVPVSMPISNYQAYTHVQLPLNLQTQQPLYSACMQPGVFPPGQPHPPQVRTAGFPYTNL